LKLILKKFLTCLQKRDSTPENLHFYCKRLVCDLILRLVTGLLWVCFGHFTYTLIPLVILHYLIKTIYVFYTSLRFLIGRVSTLLEPNALPNFRPNLTQLNNFWRQNFVQKKWARKILMKSTPGVQDSS